ncbi:expressed unknown protein [Seminavis robusta]|uniref:Uncharacterized protein n=1 Tax=Seminavis robusta TaxID=568900 RepID=A0A9N8E875_9STRA|nr:expressed unknown protein [Seminavis robusta]|eukprot:Sro601_g173640.1 n/a (200) ;mRNA; r:52226-52825
MSSKDTVNIMYLNVSFQGMLLLQSHNMTYFAASGERKADIPWNGIGKLHTGAMKSSAASDGKEEFLLKFIMAREGQEAFVFGMKDEEDLDRIRDDIQGLVKTFNIHKAASVAAGDIKPSSAPTRLWQAAWPVFQLIMLAAKWFQPLPLAVALLLVSLAREALDSKMRRALSFPVSIRWCAPTAIISQPKSQIQDVFSTR